MATICEYPEPTEDGATPEPIIHDWKKGELLRLNLRAGGIPRGSVVVARADFRSSRHGWLPAFITCAWVLTFLLVIGAWRMQHMLDIGNQTQGADPLGVAAAVLLFLTGLIARLLATSDEHGLVRKILSLLRRLAVLPPRCPLSLLLDYFFSKCPPLLWTWRCLAVAALLAATVSTVSYLLPKCPKTPFTIFHTLDTKPPGPAPDHCPPRVASATAVTPLITMPPSDGTAAAPPSTANTQNLMNSYGRASRRVARKMKRYEPPMLVEVGDFAELTRGSGSASFDAVVYFFSSIFFFGADRACSRGEAWFIVFPDGDAALAAVEALGPYAPQAVPHASGRPWLLGHWSAEDVTVVAAGRTRVAVIGACLAVRMHERTTPWRYKPLLAEAVRGIVPDAILGRATKGVFDADAYAGLRLHRAELVDLFDEPVLAPLGLVDAYALRGACLGSHPVTSSLIALDPTLACEVWLRGVDALDRRSSPIPILTERGDGFAAKAPAGCRPRRLIRRACGV